MENVFNKYKHLMRDKTREEFTKNISEHENAYISIQQPQVCVNMSRSLKRLGLCTSTLSSHVRETATTVQIAVSRRSGSKYTLFDAVKEVFNQIDNISTRGYLVGSHSSQLEIIECDDPTNIFGRYQLIIARPFVLIRGLDYVKNLALHVDEGSNKVIKLED